MIKCRCSFYSPSSAGMPSSMRMGREVMRVARPTKSPIHPCREGVRFELVDGEEDGEIDGDGSQVGHHIDMGGLEGLNQVSALPSSPPYPASSNSR